MSGHSPTFQHLLFSTEEHYILCKSKQGVFKRTDRLYLSHIQYLNGPQNPRQQKYKNSPKSTRYPHYPLKREISSEKKF